MYSNFYLLCKRFAFEFRESQDILWELLKQKDLLNTVPQINLFEHLENVSNIDYLTKAKTYLSFLEDIYEDIEYLENNPDKNITYFGFNMSGFAPINDYCYHHLGDLVLQAINKIISKYNQDTGMLVRFNGVNFIFGLKNMERQAAINFAEKIQKEFTQEIIKLPLDLGQVMNDANRAELKKYLTVPRSKSKYLKTIKVTLDINGENKEIFHELYETDIRLLPMRSKKDNYNFVKGFLLNMGFVQIKGGKNIGRKEITTCLGDLIEKLNTNSGCIEELAGPTQGTLEKDLKVGELIKLVQDSRAVKQYELSKAITRADRYSTEDLINYDSFLQRTRQLLQAYYNNSQEARDNIEIIPNRNSFNQIPEFYNFQSEDIHWEPTKEYILMPLFNYKGSPISVLKLRITNQHSKDLLDNSPEEQNKFLNIIKYVEKAFRVVDRLGGYDALTKLPTNLKFSKDVAERIGCPVGALDLDQFGAYGHMFGFKAGDRVKQGVTRIMKQMEEDPKFREYKLRFYLTGGEEFKVIGNCSAEQLAEILDEFNSRLKNLSVRIKISGEDMEKIIISNYKKEFSPNELAQIIRRARTDYENLVDASGYVDVVKMGRFHKKYKAWFTGQTASGGVVDVRDVQLLWEQAEELAMSTADYIASLANYAEEYSKEKELKKTTVVRIKG